MDVITGAAIIVGLQKVGGPAAELVKDFLGRVLAPTGDAIGTTLAHPIVEWQKRRVARAAKLAEEAAKQISEAGKEPQPVPPRLLMPILERGSLEEDEELANRWTTLLANAAMNPGDILPSFVTILGELSPLEARVLNRVFVVTVQIMDLKKSISGERNETTHKWETELHDELSMRRLQEHLDIDNEDHAHILVDNLERLRLVTLYNASADILDIDISLQREAFGVSILTLTSFGAAFIKACSREEPIGSLFSQDPGMP